MRAARSAAMLASEPRQAHKCLFELERLPDREGLRVLQSVEHHRSMRSIPWPIADARDLQGVVQRGG
jgi:hypothetical protein